MYILIKMFRQFAHVEAEEVEDDEDATTPEKDDEDAEKSDEDDEDAEKSDEDDEDAEKTDENDEDAEKTSKLNMYSPETIAGVGPQVHSKINLKLPELRKRNLDVNSLEVIAGVE